MGSDTQPVRLFAQDKKVQHSSTALRNVLADKEQTQSKLGATLAAMEDEMAEREAGWEAERGGLQAMLAAKERELVRSHCLLPGFCARRVEERLVCFLLLVPLRRKEQFVQDQKHSDRVGFSDVLFALGCVQASMRGAGAAQSRPLSREERHAIQQQQQLQQQAEAEEEEEAERAQSTLPPVLGVEGGGGEEEEEDRPMSV